MMTARYSNQQASKSRRNPCPVQPSEKIGIFSASYRCLWVRTSASTVSSASTIISECVFLQATEKTLSDVLPICQTKSLKATQKRFLAIGGLHEDKLCDTLQGMVPTNNVKTVHHTSLLPIESNSDRVGLLSPTHGQRTRQQHGQMTFHSVLINHGHASCKNKENCGTEVQGDRGLELVKPTREPASGHPHPRASLKNAPGILPVRRSLLALVGRKQTVVRNQLSPLQQKPSAVRAACGSRAQGFSPPLTRRPSSCPYSPDEVARPRRPTKLSTTLPPPCLSRATSS